GSGQGSLRCDLVHEVLVGGQLFHVPAAFEVFGHGVEACAEYLYCSLVIASDGSVERLTAGNGEFRYGVGSVVGDVSGGGQAFADPLLVSLEEHVEQTGDFLDALAFDLRGELLAQVDLRSSGRRVELSQLLVAQSECRIGGENQDRAVVRDVSDSAAHALLHALYF